MRTSMMPSKYFEAEEEDVVVNTLSPTGYPMRMLRNSPGIGSGIGPIAKLSVTFSTKTDNVTTSMHFFGKLKMERKKSVLTKYASAPI